MPGVRVADVPEPSYLSNTRSAYDTLAVDFADPMSTDLDAKPLDRAMLDAFAAVVKAAGLGPVADIGCGQGHLTGHLQSLGVPTFGIDLSPGMLARARRNYPTSQFHEGSMTELDLADGSLGGVLAFYSIIHVPEQQLPSVLAGFERALAPGGHLLLAFQVGDEPLHITERGGHQVSLVSHRRRPDHVTGLLGEAGLVVQAHLLREPDETETVQQAFLLAQKPLQ